MHLFMAREAVDKHLELAGALIDPAQAGAAKAAAFFQSAGFYAWWYPTRWLGWSLPPRYAGFGRLARHLRFVERSGRKLARSIFHGMIRYGGKLQHKQGFLFRAVDVANELFAMAAAVSRADALARSAAPEAAEASAMADLFCRGARWRVKALFRDLWDNDDARKYKLGVAILEGKHSWLESGAVSVEEGLARFETAAENAAPPTPARIAAAG
jgi:hypothetical protein